MSTRLTIFNEGLILVAIPLLWQLLFIVLVFQMLPGHFASLRELVADNREQTARAAAAAQKAARFMDWLAETKRLVSGGALDQAVVRTRSRDGETLMEDCRRTITAFLSVEERLQAERRLNVERSQRQIPTSRKRNV